MKGSDAFATIRQARTLRERHPDAPPSVVLVALVLASYANGKSGTSIRPGFALVEEHTGLGRTAVKAAVRWLEERGELRRDKQARRGSAACFTFLGVTDRPLVANGGHSDANGGHSHTPHQPDQPNPSEPSGSSGCPECGGQLLVDGNGELWCPAWREHDYARQR